MLTRILGLFLLFVALAAWWTSARSAKSNEQPYHWLKRRIGGRIRKRWLVLSKRLEVEYGDRWVVIELKKTGGKWTASVQIDWPEVDVEFFELTTNCNAKQSGSTTILELPGIGMPSCQVSSLQLANLFISQSTWSEISRLFSLAPTSKLHLLLRKKSWRIVGCIDDPSTAAVGTWVLQALAIYDQMRVHSQAEIAFGMSNTLSTLEKCSVCQQPLESIIVQCPRCHSLHHRDCWEFTGQCSRFGCRETVWVPVDQVTTRD